MGTPGMRYSLPSREIIADSIETVVGAQRMDGFVAIGGCDKNMPGCLMAMGRMNVPAVFVYGGSILPGQFQGKDVDIVSIFEAVGQYNNNLIDEKTVKTLNAPRARAPVRAGECTPPTPWRRPSKRWE
jgi:dihydroxy-acid dehydratase